MQTIHTVEDFLSRDSTALAGAVLDPCPYCGRKHPTFFDHIRIGRGAVQQVPQLAEQIVGGKPQRPVLIYDQAIEHIIQPALIEPLRALGLAVEPFPMRGEPDHLLDSGVDNGSEAADQIGPSADLLIAAGSGVIGDLTKWIATRLNRPFIICGTAPSMNGYTSITATMTENKIKLSKFLNPANAVVMDVDVLCGAPLPMIHSGMGDLAARAICNADWKLAQLLHGSYFCPLPYEMTEENERRYLAAAAGIGRREPEAIELLSEAILLSGLSMTVLEGETSPSSGAEHVISHYWDFLHHLRDLPKNFHGTQVGIGTLLVITAYQLLRELDPRTIDPEALVRTRPTIEQIEAENRALYGPQAESFNKVAREKRLPDEKYVEYVRGIRDNWETMWKELDPYVAPLEKIRNAYDLAGVPYKLSHIHRTKEDAKEALLKGAHYRPRYTILDLLWELGLFPEAADTIIERAGVM